MLETSSCMRYSINLRQALYRCVKAQCGNTGGPQGHIFCCTLCRGMLTKYNFICDLPSDNNETPVYETFIDPTLWNRFCPETFHNSRQMVQLI